MGILYFVHYFCRPTRASLLAKAPFARATQRELRDAAPAFRSAQAGPPRDFYRNRAKVVLVLRLKQLFPDDHYLRSSPVSVAFFDRWFELGASDEEFELDDVVADLTPDLFANPGNDADGEEFARTWLNQPTRYEEPRRYRVMSGDQPVGWLDAPRWKSGECHGSWSSTTNPSGKAFANALTPGVETPVSIEQSGSVRGLLRVHPSGKAEFTVGRDDNSPSPTGLADPA
jgi:hypothetical protein